MFNERWIMDLVGIDVYIRETTEKRSVQICMEGSK